MTIEEAKKLETLLAANIAELVEQFENETGLLVASISLTHRQTIQRKELAIINIETHLA